MADTLRELAAAHPELLMRECECHGTPIAYRSGNGEWREIPCWVCGSLGRRLATLGELLLALPNGWMLYDERRHGETFEWPIFAEAESGQTTPACKTPWEAAARLLVELTR